MHRVTHLASGDLWAGAEAQIYNLAKAQKQFEGLEVSAVLLNEGILADRLRRIGVAVDVIPESDYGIQGILRQLVRVLGSKPSPQILHTHRQKENVLGAAAAWLRPGWVSVRTVHGAPEPVPMVRRWKQRLILELDRIAGRTLQKRIVAVSDELASRLVPRYPSRQIEVISNGIDVEDLMQLAEGHPNPALPRVNGRKRIAFVGRLVPVKRPDLFLELAYQFNRKAKEQCAFFLFGDGPLLTGVKDAIRAKGLESTVQVIGFRPDLAACLKTMDALVITSDHEGLPMVALEALALEVPVVSRAVGGILKLLDNGACGWLVDSDDPAELRRALEECIREQAASRLKSQRGRRSVVERFSSKEMARRYSQLYASVGPASAQASVPL